MPMADIRIKVEARTNRLTLNLVFLLAWILGLKHPLVKRAWDTLKPIQIRIGNEGFWGNMKWLAIPMRRK